MRTSLLMAEHGMDGAQPVLGVSFDGTGYGTDGAIWGGEVMIADYASFARVARLKYVPLPGGDAAVKRPYRMALAHLQAAGIVWDDDLPCVAAAPVRERAVLKTQVETRFNCVDTSSMGRLFDAVASLIGVCQVASYEAQAAIELEMASATQVEQGYSFEVVDAEELIIDPAPVLREVVADVRAKVPVSVMAARFHAGVAKMIGEACLRLKERGAPAVVGSRAACFRTCGCCEARKSS